MIPVGSKVRILASCPVGRWKAGETGTLLEHDFKKYDYFVAFDRAPLKYGPRCYYFYQDEVEAA